MRSMSGHQTDKVRRLWPASEENREELDARVQELTSELAIANSMLRTQIKERNRSERELRESKEKYRFLVEAINDFVWMVDLDLRVTYASPSIEKLLGYTVEEQMERAVEEQMTPESVDLVWETIATELEREAEGADPDRAIRLELDFLHKTGSIVKVALNIGIVRDEDEKPIGAIGVARDVTEHRKAEQELAFSEQKFRTLFDNASDAIFIRNAEGRFVEANRMACDRLSYTRDELLAMTATDVITLESGYTFPVIADELKGKGTLIFETDQLTRDGKVIPTEMSCRVMDYGGEQCILSIARDITERMEAEAKAKLNEARMESLLRIHQCRTESVDELLDYAIEEAMSLTGSKLGYIFFYDEEKKELELNTWSSEAMSHEAEPGKTLTAVLDKTGLLGDTVRQARAIVLNDFQEPHSLRLVFPEGHSPLYKFLAVPVFNDDQIVGVVGMANKETDYNESDMRQLALLMNSVWHITERKRAEERFMKINEELDGYAHTVSHDLKGPLTAILLGASTLQGILGDMGLLGKGTNIDEVLELIIETIWKSNDLINDLLALAESGQEPKEVEDVDVGEVLDRILLENLCVIEEKGTKVVAAEHPGHVVAAPTHVYQLFSNLVRNCVKYCDNPHPTVYIEHLRDDSEGGHEFLIRDNGSGIPPESLDHIFAPFFKGQNGETGIGLATVEKIVNLYDGDIKAYNDHGACFEFTIKDYCR